VTVCIEECRLETFLRARNDANDGDSASSGLDDHAVASHKSTIASWLSVFKVNGMTVELLALLHYCKKLIAVNNNNKTSRVSYKTESEELALLLLYISNFSQSLSQKKKVVIKKVEVRGS